MSILYQNHSVLSKIYKHKELPVIESHEFDFFRCVEFTTNFYKKTVSELFHGNLRISTNKNRYSELFPNQKLSYWSDSPKTAKKEIIHHGSSRNILTFWAYDDNTSLFPTLENNGDLIIVDGTQLGFQNILEKCDKNQSLSMDDHDLIDKINDQNPDCVAYKSFQTKGTNFLFFERGFKKLSLKEVNLNLGELSGKNSNKIACAITTDYSPIIESYGEYFLPIAKVKMDNTYLESDEYKSRLKIYNSSPVRSQI